MPMTSATRFSARAGPATRQESKVRMMRNADRTANPRYNDSTGKRIAALDRAARRRRARRGDFIHRAVRSPAADHAAASMALDDARRATREAGIEGHGDLARASLEGHHADQAVALEAGPSAAFAGRNILAETEAAVRDPLAKKQAAGARDVDDNGHLGAEAAGQSSRCLGFTGRNEGNADGLVHDLRWHAAGKYGSRESCRRRRQGKLCQAHGLPPSRLTENNSEAQLLQHDCDAAHKNGAPVPCGLLRLLATAVTRKVEATCGCRRPPR